MIRQRGRQETLRVKFGSTGWSVGFAEAWLLLRFWGLGTRQAQAWIQGRLRLGIGSGLELALISTNLSLQGSP